jgi:hypothetical protein
LSYQGVLSNSDGSSVSDGNYDILVKFYNVSENGTPLWEELHNDVTVTNSIFNVILGCNATLNLNFDEQYWLGISINNNTELIPRLKLTSSAYAFNTINSSQLGQNSPEFFLEWSNLLNVPSEISDGDDVGIVEEVDPTIPESIKDGISWEEIEEIPDGLSDGDNIGLNSLNNIANENGNIDLIAGNNINIIPNDQSNSIEINCTTESSFNAGISTLLTSQNLTREIDTNLGYRPKIVEIALSFSGFGSFIGVSKARWVDKDQDGLGILTLIRTTDQPNLTMDLDGNTNRIGVMQTSASDAHFLKIETFTNSIIISIDSTIGNPSVNSFNQFTWYVE